MGNDREQLANGAATGPDQKGRPVQAAFRGAVGAAAGNQPTEEGPRGLKQPSACPTKFRTAPVSDVTCQNQSGSAELMAVFPLQAREPVVDTFLTGSPASWRRLR